MNGKEALPVTVEALPPPEVILKKWEELDKVRQEFLKRVVRRMQSQVHYTVYVGGEPKDMTVEQARKKGLKPTLLQPGARLVNSFWHVTTPRYEVLEVEREHPKPDEDFYGFVRYLVKCTLYRGDIPVAEGLGVYHSDDKPVRERVERAKREERTLYATDLEETVLQMARKRALVAASCELPFVSELFTIDLEDLAQMGIPVGEEKPMRKPTPQEEVEEDELIKPATTETLDAIRALCENGRVSEKTAVWALRKIEKPISEKVARAIIKRLETEMKGEM